MADWSSSTVPSPATPDLRLLSSVRSSSSSFPASCMKSFDLYRLIPSHLKASGLATKICVAPPGRPKFGAVGPISTFVPAGTVHLCNLSATLPSGTARHAGQEVQVPEGDRTSQFRKAEIAFAKGEPPSLGIIPPDPEVYQT